MSFTGPNIQSFTLSDNFCQDPVHPIDENEYLFFIDRMMGNWKLDVPYDMRIQDNIFSRAYALNIHQGKFKYVNGHYYTPSTHIANFNTSIPVTPGVVSNDVLGKCEEWIDISSFACGNVVNHNPLVSVPVCTEKGRIISESLIKVASTRIFVKAEQAIIELITNSIDSYPSNANRKVGRFGMGFFSFMYFLVGHPERCLYINSAVGTNVALIRVKYINNTLKCSFTVRKCLNIRGTTISLRTGFDVFTPDETAAFTKYVYYTKDIDRASIYLNGNTKIDSSIISTDSVDILIDPTLIRVSDQGSGIGIDVVMKSLLVPSSSTKGLVNSGSTANEFTNNSSMRSSVGISTFRIVVNQIALVSLNIEGPYSFTIDLPHTVKVPVSRDDIIIEESKDILLKSLLLILSKAEEMKNVLHFENALKTYINFTANINNKKLIKLFINNIYDVFYKDKIVISEKHVNFYEKLNLHYIVGSLPNYTENTKVIKSIVDNLDRKFVDRETFASKIIVKIPIMENSELFDGDTYSYIFVPLNFLTPEWSSIDVKSIYRKEALSLKNRSGPDEDPFIKMVKGVTLRAIENYQNPKLSIAMDNFDTEFNQSIQNARIIFGDNLPMYLRRMVSIFENIKTSDSHNLKYKIIRSTKSYNFNPEKDYSVLQNYILFLIDAVKEYHQTEIENMLISPFSISGIDYAIMLVDEGLIGKLSPLEILAFSMISGTKGIYTFNPKTLSTILPHFTKIYVENMKISDLIVVNTWETNRILDIAINTLSGNASSNLRHENMPSPQTLTSGYKFKLKQLISLTFVDPHIDLKNAHRQPDNIPLQIIEISVNAGTTKDFIQATLTELVQNSRDAIRILKSQTNQDRNKLHIRTSFDADRKLAKVSIHDFVGMTKDNFISMCTPFYSTKKASELVTGEMGTGFFNIYRESLHVQIISIKSGKRIRVEQFPIRDSLQNVVDISTNLIIDDSKDPEGTRITFTFPVKSVTEVHNTIDHFVRNRISLMGFDELIYNNTPITQQMKKLYSIDGLESFYCENLSESSIQTKGVPFSSLYDFFSGKEEFNISRELLMKVSSELVINIKHGFYTPVQSRTSINILPEKLIEFKKFIIATFAFYFKQIIYDITSTLTVKNNATGIQRNVLDNFLDNWESNFFINNYGWQIVNSPEYYDLALTSSKLLFQNFPFYKYSGLASFNRDVRYQPLNSENILDPYNNVNRLVSLIREVVADENNHDIDKEFTKDMMQIMFWWAYGKNSQYYYYTSTDQTKIIAPYIHKIMKIFVKMFIKAVKPPENHDDIIINISPISVNSNYHRASRTLTIALKNFVDSGLIDFIKKIKMHRESRNKDWIEDDIFIRMRIIGGFPPVTMVHELEHANRSAELDAANGVHGPRMRNGKNISFFEYAFLVGEEARKKLILRQWIEVLYEIEIPDVNLDLIKFTENPKKFPGFNNRGTHVPYNAYDLLVNSPEQIEFDPHLADQLLFDNHAELAKNLLDDEYEE